VIAVDVTVTDETGHIVTDLTAEDFRLYEDGQIQTIAGFAHETGLPVRIALLIDTSGSGRDRLSFARQAGVRFLEASLTGPEDRAFIVAYGAEIALLGASTNDIDRLSDALDQLGPWGGSPVYEAVFEAARLLSAVPYRRIIVLVGDGEDNTSRVSLTDAVDAATETEARIYAVSTNTGADLVSSRGQDALNLLARETGGLVFSETRIGRLDDRFEDAAEELRTRYRLMYSPTNPGRDGDFRRIRVEVAREGYAARTRSGYYARTAVSPE